MAQKSGKDEKKQHTAKVKYKKITIIIKSVHFDDTLTGGVNRWRLG